MTIFCNYLSIIIDSVSNMWQAVSFEKRAITAISVSAEKVTAPIPIPKFGIGYGSRYRYRISVGH